MLWALTADTEGVFPTRLKSDEWNSGETVWLLDVIAPTRQLATAVLMNFKQVAKKDKINIHPVVTRVVDPEWLNSVSKAEDNLQAGS